MLCISFFFIVKGGGGGGGRGVRPDFLVKLVFIIKGGGGVHPDFHVKLVFETAVAQQTGNSDQILSGSLTTTAHR